MVLNEIELEEQLKEAGNRLLDPPSSIDELLSMLDKLEHLLINVEQAPSRSMQDALLPTMKALISNALLRNSDADVKVSVASCISEITRITAPDAPYDDDHMKEIFQLIVAAIEKLSHVSSHSYTKAVSILDTIAKVRSCLVMLDLELDELIVKMFEHFSKIIRSNHPHAVFTAMETIMTLIIDESDDISVGLLTSLLASVRKENQSISPSACKLGEEVITNCAAKLKPYLKELLQSEIIARDDYASIVASICEDESHNFEHAHVNCSGDHLVTKGLLPNADSPGEIFQAVDGISKSISNGNGSTRNVDNDMKSNSSKILEKCSVVQQSEITDALCNDDPEINLEMDPGTVPRKRGWKPNSLMNPEEGYDHCWISAGRKTAKLSRERKSRDKGRDVQSENALPEKEILSLAHVTELAELSPKTGGAFGGSHPKRGRPKKNVTDSSSLKIPKEEVLNGENEEKTLSEDEVSLRKLSEGRSNEKVKQREHSRKISFAAKTAEEVSLPSAHVLTDEKAGEWLGQKGKPLLKSTKVGLRNINKVQTDIRKRNLVCGISDVDVAEASSVKKIKSVHRDGSYKEETPKTNLKRKRTPRKEVKWNEAVNCFKAQFQKAFFSAAATLPPRASDLGFGLVGSRIKVWWPMDKMFYEAVVDSYDHIKKRHRILYADGDEEILNLKRQRWELIEDNILCNKELETDIPKADSSSDKPLKGKGLLAKSELAKQLKVVSKRSGSTSISKRKAKASGGKSAGGTSLDEPVIENATDNSSRPETGSEGACKNSSSKLKIAGTKREQMTPETASPSSDGSSKGEYSNQPSRNEQQNEVESLDPADTN